MRLGIFASVSCVPDSYMQETYALGKALGEAGHSLVFGGANEGLLKAIGDGFQDAGAEIIGITPGYFLARGMHPGCTSVLETKDLYDRKQEMIRLSDAFIILPGGIGTLDEWFTVLALKSVKRCDKPIFVLNSNGFYDGILQNLAGMRVEDFVREDIERMMCICATGQDLAAQIGAAEQ